MDSAWLRELARLSKEKWIGMSSRTTLFVAVSFLLFFEEKVGGKCSVWVCNVGCGGKSVFWVPLWALVWFGISGCREAGFWEGGISVGTESHVISFSQSLIPGSL